MRKMTTQSDLRNPVASPRKGRNAGVVNELSVFLKVKPGHEKQIREVFASDDADADRPAKATKLLNSVGTVHEARIVLFDNDTRLLIATSFDGDWDVYIDDFARTLVLRDWERFLVHCEGYPDAAGMASLSLFQQKELLTANQVTAARYDRAYPDVTSKEIMKALRVQTVFQQLLDEASS
jgi:hypothetical protein